MSRTGHDRIEEFYKPILEQGLATGVVSLPPVGERDQRLTDIRNALVELWGIDSHNDEAMHAFLAGMTSAYSSLLTAIAPMLPPIALFIMASNIDTCMDIHKLGTRDHG